MVFIPTPRFIGSLLKETVLEWDRDNVSRLAAALAYYTIFSLAPLLVIVIAISGRIFGEEAARGQIVEQIQGLIGRPGAEFVQQAVQQAGRHGAGVLPTVLGLVTLFIGATGVYAQLQDGLNHVWGVAPRPRSMIKSLLRTRILSFAMVLATGFLLVVSLVLSAAVEAFGDHLQRFLPRLPLGPEALSTLFSFILITLLFAMIYVILPDAEVPWRHIWFGAAVTSILFTLGKYVIGVYLGNTRVGSVYGAAGTLAILLIWIYYSAQIFYFGAELTQVYTRLRGSPIRPSPHATHIVRIRVKADSLAEAHEIAERELAAAEAKPPEPLPTAEPGAVAAATPPKVIETSADEHQENL
jgi:membrane protein